MQAVPRFFLIVLIVSLFGSSYGLIILAIALTTWPATARAFRAQVLTVLGRDFVVASRASGGSDPAIFVRHVLPQRARSWLRNCWTRWAGRSLGSRSQLSGPRRSDRDQLGAVARGRSALRPRGVVMSVFPGIAMTITVLGCNLIADSLVSARPPLTVVGRGCGGEVRPAEPGNDSQQPGRVGE